MIGRPFDPEERRSMKNSELAKQFAERHRQSKPLVLPNVWDAGSARLMRSLGAEAIATTSSGLAWAYGYPDGDKLPIEVQVSDNGPGVDAALVDHIFEPFVTSKPNGQGLGLALVSKLVRDMNGRITYERDEKAGLTHFRVHLPMARQEKSK